MNDYIQLLYIPFATLTSLAFICFSVAFVLAKKFLSKTKEDQKFISVLTKCPTGEHEFKWVTRNIDGFQECLKCNYIPRVPAAKAACPPHSYTYFRTIDGKYAQCIKCNFIPKE
jgi:hypothetical protein